jgi:hypothetical protein
MESCVALVEDQLKVVESPLAREVGLACSVTVGRAAGGGGAAGGGVDVTGFLAQPIVKKAAAKAVNKQAR